MSERGLAGAYAPQGNAMRTLRAPPRRASRIALTRRSLGAHVPPKVEHRAVALGAGRFRLITTTTTVHVVERVVDQEYLEKMGIAVPQSDVPWKEEAQSLPPPRRPVGPQEGASPFTAAMGYWRELGFPIDRRMPELLGGWLDKFGLEGVLGAMHAAAGSAEKGPPYLRLVQAFRRLRDETGSAP